MAKASLTEKMKVSKARYFKAVTNYASYPEFVAGCGSVDVKRERGNEAAPGKPGIARVTYAVEVMGQKLDYTLDHIEDIDAGTISWKLASSAFVKHNEGLWTIRETGSDSCEVTYDIDIEFKIPVPGFILNRLVKGSLPPMLKGFEDHA
jgi:ribosome-associated toxin RatA of RatAB toxin-antitoxin module